MSKVPDCVAGRIGSAAALTLSRNIGRYRPWGVSSVRLEVRLSSVPHHAQLACGGVSVGGL